MFIFNKCNKYQEFNSVNLMSRGFFMFFKQKIVEINEVLQIPIFKFCEFNVLSFFYLCFSSRKIVYILTNTNNLVYSILFMFFILFHMINNFVNLLFFNQCNNIDYIIVLSVYFLNLFIYLFSYNFVQYLFDIFKMYIPIHS